MSIARSASRAKLRADLDGAKAAGDERPPARPGEFAPDSSLEEAGFESSVPRATIRDVASTAEEPMVCRLPAGGSRIRTLGPPWQGEDKRREVRSLGTESAPQDKSGGIRLPIAWCGALRTNRVGSLILRHLRLEIGRCGGAHGRVLMSFFSSVHNPEIMLGMLVKVLCGDSIATSRRLSCEDNVTSNI